MPGIQFLFGPAPCPSAAFLARGLIRATPGSRVVGLAVAGRGLATLVQAA